MSPLRVGRFALDRLDGREREACEDGERRMLLDDGDVLPVGVW